MEIVPTKTALIMSYFRRHSSEVYYVRSEMEVLINSRKQANLFPGSSSLLPNTQAPVDLHYLVCFLWSV